jgi:hypothetical protein
MNRVLVGHRRGVWERPIGIALLIWTCTTPSTLRAQETDPDPSYYQFYPGTPLHLGGGFSPNDVAEAKIDCLVVTTHDLDDGAALTTNYSAVLVSNSDQLKRALHVDTKVDASYLAFSGGASFKYSADGLFSETSMTVVITAESEFARKAVATWTFQEGVRDLVAKGRAFGKQCGSRFADIERRGASVSAIITIYGMTREDRKDVGASISGGGGFGPLSAHAEAAFNNQYARAQAAQEVSVQVVSTGGTGFGALGETIKSMSGGTGTVAAIDSALGNYVKTFTNQNAAPLGYHVISMEFTGWDPNSADLWSEENERQLRQLVSAYRDTELKLDAVNAILAGTDPRRTLIPVSKDDQLRALVTAYSGYLETVAAAHKACKASGATNKLSCKVPQPNFPPSPVRELPQPPVGYYALTQYFAKGSTQWSAIETHARLSGFYLWKYDWDDSWNPPTVRADNLDARVNSILPGGRGAELYYYIEGQQIVGVQLAFQKDGTSSIQDIWPLTLMLTTTANKFELDAWYGGIPNGNMRNAMIGYMHADAASLDNQLGKKDVVGRFLLHIVDGYNRNFYLPVAAANWHVNHYNDGRWIPFHPEVTYEIQPIFQ